MSDNEKLVTIRTYSYHNESLIDKAKLESAGIPCMLADENTILIQPFYSNAIGGIKLQVMENDVEQALQILEDTSFESTIESTDPEENEYKEEQDFSEKQNAKAYKWGCISMIIIALVALAFLIIRNFVFN